MPAIYVGHHAHGSERAYGFSTTPDLNELFPEGFILDEEAVTLLIEHLTQVQATISFGFGVNERGLNIYSTTGDNSWVGVCEFIEPVLMNVVRDCALRTTGLEIEVA